MRPPEKLDEAAAREIAVKQGLGVVLSGSLDRQGNGYGISVKAAQAVTGDVIASAKGRASNKDQVFGAATKLVTDGSQGARRRDVRVRSVVRHGQPVGHFSGCGCVTMRRRREAASNGKFEEARQSFSKAVELDPKFGIGYQALAVVSRNLGKQQDAEKYIKEASSHLDGMTERERYTTRGLFYRVTGDYQQCVKEYGDLIARYAADVVGAQPSRAVLDVLRNMPGAAG